MKTYKIPVIWQLWGIMKIEAKSLEEAKEMAFESEALPDGDYIDDSLSIDEEGVLLHNPEEE